MSDSEHASKRQGIVLDFLAHGRSEDGGRGYGQSPIAFAVDPEEFTLYELVLTSEADITIGDRTTIESTDQTDIESFREIEYGDLSGGAQSELEYVVEEIIEAEEDRFVSFFNDAQPITLRLHQLNLLPGIGKKLRNAILDERKRKPFESFADVSERISGLHSPAETIRERIVEELREEDLKYRIFVRDDEE